MAFRAQRSTILQHKPSLQELSTPEHLSAALLGWPSTAFRLEAPQGHVPLLDGSASPWVSILQELAGPPQQYLVFYEAPLRESHQWEHGFWQVEPHAGEGLQIHYSVDRHGFYQKESLLFLQWSDLEPILGARTYILEPDYQQALQQGLIPGAQEGCGLLLQGQGEGCAPNVLSGGALRHPHEPIRHKILDLLGDLALLGPFLPKLRIRIHNGGHVAHQQILTRLLPYVIH